MREFKAMLKNEFKLSLRGLDMLIFAICMPLAVLVILGMIYGDKPAFEGAGYSFVEQSFGALVTIAICAGGVMGIPLVVSEYRNKKILKRFKVTPIRPMMILFVQIVIYTIYSLVSLLLLYLTAKILFGFQLHGNLMHFIGGYLLVMISMFSIGIMVGSIAPDTKMAGVIASMLYFPMLIFSGATLPYEVMPDTLQKIASALPLTQGIKLLKVASLGQSIDSIFLPTLILAILAIICVGISIKFFKWE